MPLELLNPIDRESLRRQFQNAKPVPWFKIDNFLRQDFADRCLSAFPTYEQVQTMGKTFSNINEKGKFQVTDSTKFPDPLASLNELLASRDFLELMEYVTGMPSLLADEQLVGGGLHSTGPRGHLDVHLDFNYIKERDLHRRLNILVYLNKDWQQDWGGEFELWDEDVQVCHQKFLPIFNRCVVFNTNDVSFHGVNAVKCPPGESRKSFAAYYYTKEAPPHWNGQAHSTIFKARPGEKLKSVLMPMEQTGKAVSKFFSRSASKLKKAVKGE
jgi:Rps23 Pro-64 3,4-dihydroxylase Tpa1-like proline 4-hydroxylase